MNENNKEMTLTEKLLKLLNELNILKTTIRGAKRSLACCRRNDRRVKRLAAAASEAAEKAAAADAKSAAAKAAAAESEAKEAAEKAAAAEEKVSAVRGRYASKYADRLAELRNKRRMMIERAKNLMSKIGGYSRRDRKEVMRLRVAVGI